MKSLALVTGRGNPMAISLKVDQDLQMADISNIEHFFFKAHLHRQIRKLKQNQGNPSKKAE